MYKDDVYKNIMWIMIKWNKQDNVLLNESRENRSTLYEIFKCL